jgi:multidrug efflux pump subunit AcrB
MTVLVGAVTLAGLPIERYPDITPPTVLVSTTYPGADAKVLSRFSTNLEFGRYSGQTSPA